jgi:hypothetical protein
MIDIERSSRVRVLHFFLSGRECAGSCDGQGEDEEELDVMRGRPGGALPSTPEAQPIESRE